MHITTLPVYELILLLGSPFVRETVFGKGSSEAATKGLSAIFLLIIIPVVVIFFFILKSVYSHTIGKKLKSTLKEDYAKEARKLENEGNFVSAAVVYENKLKDTRKAASLYEKGHDYDRAAMLYDLLGMTEKAKEMYIKAGSLENAAEVAILEGEFDEAAALYDRAGKKIDVAKVMKGAGKTIYAVKAYREAGEYKKAALLLKDEGMLKEAAEMFGFSLYDKKPDTATMEDFYSYAGMLEETGDVQKAAAVYRDIDRADPSFRDVRERLVSLSSKPGEEPVPEGMTTVRSIIKSGKTEPKYSLKLWVQVLKGLQQAYRNGWPPGLLSPDNIIIDAQNNVSFLKRTQPSAYVPPEITKELVPDERADIYSAGVILFEIMTGNLEGLGTVRVIDILDDVPEWLDDIVLKCLKKVREDRYQSIQEIFTDLMNLSRGRTDTEALSG